VPANVLPSGARRRLSPSRAACFLTVAVNRHDPSRRELRTLRRLTWTGHDPLDQHDKLRTVFQTAFVHRRVAPPRFHLPSVGATARPVIPFSERDTDLATRTKLSLASTAFGSCHEPTGTRPSADRVLTREAQLSILPVMKAILRKNSRPPLRAPFSGTFSW
jgi:hypothetical protein